MSDKKVYYQVLHSDYLRNHVLIWWARLQGNKDLLNKLEWLGNKTTLSRGVRAELRRCHTVDEVFLTEGFRLLWMPLSAHEEGFPGDMVAWATVVAVLADVRTNSDMPFATALGSQKEQTGKPYVSELRFSQLQKSADADSFLRRARRSVALLGQTAAVLSLADNTLHWHREKQGLYAAKPTHRLAVRWATDYFTAMAKYQK
ncbi:type I-E CRISPR-associated protein Cse2/CasB [Marinobacter sp. M3C]|jgi:CRISPR system Cascade subunit CasB|uniref:type I-E CRISPR-associated protein Cse2/CasB n=1 Tax=Marinobacter sp. M3C TaxID=2917715 RepID=UPI00200BCD3C|nr:type I-E CRISPR-associated protein Cse2/CasB [Marinobacter sp. M3C]MCL1476305.1 type I-E CRISPR-associated protein Cse2/CasB [Marinobacter sp.]MCL1479991.1 type I-E CRISPR-associated protein Cse2/CasB [Marinobacter sp.]MCL1483063.1 type I-E CRISPR-associated protein Cse2/CasB [Marinobacter sp.]UQG60658.1 type I-E CRISPR-associated protein Cse2/CasB [Marinobacter sp. M3C]